MRSFQIWTSIVFKIDPDCLIEKIEISQSFSTRASPCKNISWILKTYRLNFPKFQRNRMSLI